MTPEQTKWFLIIVGGTLAVVFIIAARGKWRKRSSNLDQIFSRREIEQKGGRTLKLVRFIAQQDPSFSEEKLAGQVRSTFLLLQKCWQVREYGPMRPLMMADLFRDHLRQIEGMKRNHEINMIDGLQVDAIDLVNVRYPLNKDEREFTALITASATDYYLDDRTHERLRGDDAPAPFQEFWTFQYSEGKWLLREIEQAAESDILSDENYFEQFTDKAVDQVYGKAAGTEGPAGPWAEGGALAKEQRIERLLNHLVLTDKLWERNGMLQTARSIFIAVTGAWESGTFAAGLNEKLFPELARDLSEAVKKNEQAGIALEFRNLAVRRAELVLVKNFADNRNDEFVVRIRAHAQKVMKQGGTAVRQEDDVTAFEEYLTFGRLDDQWKLKEIVVPAAGAVMLGQENIDQDSTPRQLEWYYQHKRPV